MEQEWYPGVAFQGEGIFVSFEDPNQDFTPSGEASAKWSRIHESSNRYPKELFRDESERDELHPTFVWWHTLAHLLIRTISAESGYSVASIRERVYVKLNGRTTKSGILLYATQPGSEGTLGGLIALVPHFQEMFDLSVEQMRTCSGDPLCVAHSFEEGQYNGAACYGCLLLSETSCEHRNLWLDRRVLLESSL